MTDDIRSPACSGRFYPADPDDLRRAVREFLADGASPDEAPDAVIGPHAGYVFSGNVAGSAYSSLSDHADHINRVVLTGPSHFVRFRGLAASPADAFETPLGRVPLATDRIRSFRDAGYLQIDPEPHRREHALETHLPFLQATLGDFDVLPVVTGETDPDALTSLLAEMWDEPDTLIAVSSDLSHYLDYETAQKVDRQTCEAIEQKRPEDLDEGSACGRTSIRALLRVADDDSRVRTHALKNSGDTAGDKDEVVGYGAWTVG